MKEAVGTATTISAGPSSGPDSIHHGITGGQSVSVSVSVLPRSSAGSLLPGIAILILSSSLAILPVFDLHIAPEAQHPDHGAIEDHIPLQACANPPPDCRGWKLPDDEQIKGRFRWAATARPMGMPPEVWQGRWHPFPEALQGSGQLSCLISIPEDAKPVPRAGSSLQLPPGENHRYHIRCAGYSKAYLRRWPAGGAVLFAGSSGCC